MIFILISYLLMVVFSGLMGLNNAVLYSRLGHEAFPGNEHKVFIWQVVIFILFALSVWLLHPIQIILLLFMCPLQYSYFHNGVYQVARGKIAYRHRPIKDLMPLWGYDNARKDGSAKINYTYKERKIQFIISLFILGLTIALGLITNNFIF